MRSSCPSCGGTEPEIHDHGHRLMADLKPCPEACTCLPECFSMAEHHARGGPDEPGTARQFQRHRERFQPSVEQAFEQEHRACLTLPPQKALEVLQPFLAIPRAMGLPLEHKAQLIASLVIIFAALGRHADALELLDAGGWALTDAWAVYSPLRARQLGGLR